MQHDKLGSGSECCQRCTEVEEVSANVKIDTEGDDSLMAMLWRLQKLLGDSTNDRGLAGLRRSASTLSAASP